MGRLIKNHWARLVVLSAATYQFAAGVHGFFWPKILWDFATKNLDAAVKPIPVLQILNVISGLSMLALEWPAPFLAGSGIHRSLEARLAIIPLVGLMAGLLYQGANAAVYYIIGLMAYFWAYSEGEIICSKPWSLPERIRPGATRV